jgi:hypothetical protein
MFSSGIRSLIGESRFPYETPFSALPPELMKALALKLFRGEPAITRFD